MATTDYGTVQTQITRQDPAVEAYRLGLLEDVQQFVRQNIGALQDPAQREALLGGLDYNVAGLSRGEQMGIAAAEQGLGAYLPYVQQGSRAVQGGMNLTGMGAGLVGQAAQLAAAQRAVPYTYQRGAAQGIGQATQLGTALGTQAYGALGQAPQFSMGSTFAAQRGLQNAALGAQNVAARTARGAGRLFDPMAQSMGMATSGAYGAAGRGQFGADIAAQRARSSTAAAQQQLMDASQAAGQATQLGTALGGQSFQGLNRAGQQGYGFAERGQFGADIAAERARASTAAAQQQLMGASQFGLGSAQQGIASLAGTGGMYDPRMTYGYMSPFENAAIQATLSDIGRQGEIAQQGVRAQAARAGAFGGSRQAVAEQELQRNVLEQQARTAAQLRAQGFESAAQRSQQAFEQAQGRQQQLASLTGQLGQAGAGTAASAAQAAGQLGLSAEQLAQTGALQGAGLGLQASGQDIQAQQAAGQLGLGIGQLGQAGAQIAAANAQAAGQLGLSTEQLAQASALQGAQLGLSANQIAAANAQSLAQTGLNIEQLSAQTGLQAQQLAGQFAQQAGALSQNQAQLMSQAAQAQGALGQGIGSLGLQGAQALGNLGIQYGQLAQQDVNQLGQLATQYGQLGGQMGQLGVQQAGMGEIGQNITNAQLQNVLAAGGLERGVAQSQLDATRLSNLQRQQFPYQQYGFLSDIYSGVPSSQSVTTGVMGGQTSPFQQAIGLGISGLSAAAGAQRAGLFG